SPSSSRDPPPVNDTAGGVARQSRIQPPGACSPRQRVFTLQPGWLTSWLATRGPDRDTPNEQSRCRPLALKPDPNETPSALPGNPEEAAEPIVWDEVFSPRPALAQPRAVASEMGKDL